MQTRVLLAVLALFATAIVSVEKVRAQDFLFKFGTSGTAEGQFKDAYFLATDSSGNTYVADQGNNRIQKFDRDGNFLRMWGYGVQDGRSEFQICTRSTAPCRAGIQGRGDGQFKVAVGIAVDPSGNVYAVDSAFEDNLNDITRVQVFNSQGNFLFKFGSHGGGDGQFNGPGGITTDNQVNVYVVDTFNNRVQVLDAAGKFIRKFGSFGTGDGQFDFPTDIKVDSAGNIIVVDTDNNRVQKFDSHGNFLSKLGTHGTGEGQFDTPIGIALDAEDNLYVADSNNQRVQLFDPTGAFLFEFGGEGNGDGEFVSGTGPYGIAVDHRTTRISVADPFSNRIQVFDGFGQGGGPGPDADHDGVPNEVDLDSDNDGIPNSAEVGILDNPDEDGIANELDLDSDGDGIPDVIEAGGTDRDGDGRIDDFSDVNENGLADSVEAARGGSPLPVPDTDEDGLPDFLDLDSDGDGSSDVVEAGGVDGTRDDILDALLDAEGDGLADSVQTTAEGDPLPLPDGDHDGIPDFQDSSDDTVDDGGCAMAPRATGSSAVLLLLLPVLVTRMGARLARKR